MNELKQMKVHLWIMVAVGIAVTVYAALGQNTTLALIIFVAQGTVGSMLNAKYRNEVFRLIEEADPALYNDLTMTADISPKAAEQRGKPYPTEIAALLSDCLLVQKVNKWMPFAEVLLFFALQVVLFGKVG